MLSLLRDAVGRAAKGVENALAVAKKAVNATIVIFMLLG
jgi:hypothetical protein